MCNAEIDNLHKIWAWKQRDQSKYNDIMTN